MSNVYKLDERAFSRGVEKTLTVRPIVNAFRNVAEKTMSQFESKSQSSGKKGKVIVKRGKR